MVFHSFCGFAAKEVVAGGAEALEYLDIHLLRCKTDGLPLVLQLDYFLRTALPVAGCLVFGFAKLLNLLAEGCLAGKILVFLGANLLEVLLVALVDNGRSSLEAGPNLLAQLLGNGANLAVLLVQLLQLVERADDVLLVGKVLGSLAQLGLKLEVLLEVVLASLRVELKQVVELLYVQLIVAPKLACLVGRNGLDVLPLLLQLLELVV